MAEQFTGWDQFVGFAWARFLSRRPEFADRCDWSKLKPLAWRQLLMRMRNFLASCGVSNEQMEKVRQIMIESPVAKE